MGSPQKVNVFFGDHIVNNGKPGIQLLRNFGLRNAGLRNYGDPLLRRAMGIALTLWVRRYGPSLGLVGWSLGKYVTKVLRDEWRKPTHADTRLAPSGTMAGETRTLKNPKS